MLRISKSTAPDDRNDSLLLRLEGQVTGKWVEELRRVCADTLAGNRRPTYRLMLDLAGVQFIDADGIALFREMVRRGARLANCSMFVAEQLKEVVDANS